MTKEVGYMVFNGASGHGLYDSLTEAIERAKLEARSSERDVYVRRDVLISEVVYKVPKQKIFQPTNKWRLIDYFDVWKNEEGRWEVNNLCVERDDLVIPDDATDHDLIEMLKEIEFFSSNADDVTVNVIHDYGDMIEFENSGKPYEDYAGYPLCRLEKVYE